MIKWDFLGNNDIFSKVFGATFLPNVPQNSEIWQSIDKFFT